MALPGVYEIFNDRWSNQTVWLYSDPHFGDKELANNIPNRPSNEEQIKMINSKVGRADTIIFLGDIGDIKCAEKIRGYKVLICGNHDVGATNYRGVFQQIYTGPLMIGEKLILSHEPIPGITWAMNIHGHVHDKRSKNDMYHFNCCADVINYTPINFNQWLKEGHMSKIQSIHRQTIDTATVKARKRKNPDKKR